MSLKKIVQDWLNTTYWYTQDTNTFEAPLLLLVKEAVLDIIWANKKNNAPKIKRTIYSTDIGEIISSLTTSKQKQTFLEMFDNNPEARFLNLTGCLNSDNIWFDIELYRASLLSDQKLWMIPNWRSSYNLWVLFANKSNHQEALWYFENMLLSENIPDDFLESLYWNLGICYHEWKDYAKALTYYEKALDTETKNFTWGIYFKIWLVYEENWEYSEALRHYHRSLDFLSEDEKYFAYYHIWISNIELWNYDEAKEFLLKAYMDEFTPKSEKIWILEKLIFIENNTDN